MIRLLLAITSFVGLNLVTGCVAGKYYSPALFKNDVAYLPKPASTDPSKSAFYVSGTYGLHSGGNLSDQVDFATLALIGAHLLKI